MLDIVIAVVVISELCFAGLLFLIFCFFIGSEVSVFLDKVFKARQHFRPVQFHSGTIGLLQLDALTAVVNPALSGDSMGTAADPVFLSQKVRFLFGCVIAGKIRIDAAFTALNIPTAIQTGINLVIGDKHIQFWNFWHLGRILTARKIVVLQHIQKTLRIVQTKSHQISILLIGIKERG